MKGFIILLLSCILSISFAQDVLIEDRCEQIVIHVHQDTLLTHLEKKLPDSTIISIKNNLDTLSTHETSGGWTSWENEVIISNSIIELLKVNKAKLFYDNKLLTRKDFKIRSKKHGYCFKCDNGEGAFREKGWYWEIRFNKKQIGVINKRNSRYQTTTNCF